MPAQPSYADLQRRVDSLIQEATLQKQVCRELEREIQSLRSLVDLVCLANAAESLHGSLRLLADRANDLLDSEVICIALIDRSTGDLVLGGWSCASAEAWLEPAFPVPARGGGASVMVTRHGIILKSHIGQIDPDPILSSLCAQARAGSAMVAPVSEKGGCLGVIYATKSGEPDFQETHLNVLMRVGHFIGSEVKRRTAEEKLRESEERFRFMAETTGDVLYRLRYRTMQYDYLSPSIQDLTGYGQEEIQAMGFSRLVARIDIPGQENVDLEILRNNRLHGKLGEYRADYLIETKQGDPKWIRDHSFPWVDECSTVIGSVGILSDVTEYKRAETRVLECTNDLIESEEKYRTLVENVPLVVYRMGHRQDILFVNQFFQEVFGYNVVQVFQNPTLWAGCVYEDDRKRIEDLRNRCYQEGKEFLAEYRVIHKDGHLVYILDHAVPYRAQGGQVVSLDGIIIDMSDKVRLQDQLLQTHGIKTLSEISARLAHEIRNPLVSAGGFARLLLTHMSDDDPNRTKAEIIVKEVGRLELILHMLLAYIKPLDLQVSPVDLNAMIEGILNILHSNLRDKNIQLESRLTNETIPISVDPQQMENALEAILRNTINQCNSHGVLNIDTHRQGKTFVIHMRYPIHHMSTDDIEHFFYPFTSFAACQTNTALPLSKIIINKHGGQTEVTLSENNHLTITITLPLRSD